jgi:hypothetical protein
MLAHPLPPPPPSQVITYDVAFPSLPPQHPTSVAPPSSVVPDAPTVTFAPIAPDRQTMTYAQLVAARAALPPLPQRNLRMRSVVSFTFITII